MSEVRGVTLRKSCPLLTAGFYTRSDVRLTLAARALATAITAECEKISRLN